MTVNAPSPKLEWPLHLLQRCGAKRLLPFGLSLLLGLGFGFAAHAQTLLQAMSSPEWRVLIFVSSKMPRASLITLARQAERSQAVLVLNGFAPDQLGLGAAQQWVGELNRACCTAQGGASFEIDPKKFQQYAIQSVPTFVITPSESAPASQWSKVSGDMDLGNAYKYFASQSQLQKVRQFAEMAYQKL